ncbi:MAG: hypothetical protein KAS66_08295 [Candidatus Omnitrophica bacterium]|nr:hypothetical protein [Candidatus Omnitrophota bacterium]
MQEKIERGVVAETIEQVLWEVAQYGKDRANGTREMINYISVIEFKNSGGSIVVGSSEIDGMNIGREQSNIIRLYNSQMNNDWERKLATEDYHYAFLQYGLLHKIRETNFFHQEGVESRKNIIFSSDCISSIQLIVRDEEVGLMVHMRSSDVFNLLPLDLLALTKILRAVIHEHSIDVSERRVCMHITYGSLHIYEGDIEAAIEVGVGPGGEKYNETVRRNL